MKSVNSFPSEMSLRPGQPDFLDLPWGVPLADWGGCCPNLVDVPVGASRHPVQFINYDGNIFALKELPADIAQQEYEMLCYLEQVHMPAVQPVGHALTNHDGKSSSVLITRYLDQSLPFRLLFVRDSLETYREYLLDAIAGLIVQLHLASVYWGDCSLSNTLFRRDAGQLQAYLVDAETAVIYKEYVPPIERHHDLEIMEGNVNGELYDLKAAGLLSSNGINIPLEATGAYIRLRYQRLWDEITREDIINPGEQFRITERIRVLNDLGFSVGDVQLADTPDGDQLRLKVVVTDRNYHRDQLYNLTGMDMEERQARTVMNEIQEHRAMLSRNTESSTPLSVAAHHWVEHVYSRVIEKLSHLVDDNTTKVELYCQVLEHKWYMSERAQQDVGHDAATEDYLSSFGG